LFKNFVFVTHFEKPMRNMLPEIRKLMNADRILVQNTNNARMIEQLGFDPKNISVVYGAVDRKFYFPQSVSTLKQELFVLIVGDCKPRTGRHTLHWGQ
jgi:hypothetical protein